MRCDVRAHAENFAVQLVHLAYNCKIIKKEKKKARKSYRRHSWL